MAEIRFNTGVGIVSFDTAGGTGNPGSPIRSKVEVSNNPGVNVLSMPAVGFASSLPEGVNTIGSVGFAGHQFQTYNGLEGLGGAYVATTVDATAGNDFWLINFPGPQLEAGYAVLDWWNVSGTDPALDLTFSLIEEGTTNVLFIGRYRGVYGSMSFAPFGGVWARNPGARIRLEASAAGVLAVTTSWHEATARSV